MRLMNVILDRYEGNHAIVELPDQQLLSVPAVLFDGAKEGDVISILVDPAQTRVQKEKIAKLMKDVMVDP